MPPYQRSSVRSEKLTTAPAALRVEGVEKQLTEGVVFVVGANIFERPFERRFALGLRIASAKIDGQIAELQLADELAVDQLPLEPRGVLDQLFVVVLKVDALLEAGALQRVVDIEVGEAELVFAHFQAEAEQTVDQHAIVRGEFAEVRVELQLLVYRGLFGNEAVAPLVADRAGGDHAEAAIGENVERSYLRWRLPKSWRASPLSFAAGTDWDR